MRLREALRLQRIDHAHPVAGRIQLLGKELVVDARRLHHDLHLPGSRLDLLAEPALQFRRPLERVLERLALALESLNVPQPQQLYFPLRNVDSNVFHAPFLRGRQHTPWKAPLTTLVHAASLHCRRGLDTMRSERGAGPRGSVYCSTERFGAAEAHRGPVAPPAIAGRLHTKPRYKERPPRRDSLFVSVTACGPAAHRPSEDRRESVPGDSARASLRATVLGGAMRISASDASAQSAATKTKTASVRCAVSARDPASSTLRFFILCSTQRRRLGRVDSEGPGPGRA